MVAYRVHAGALLLAGDPVGPPDTQGAMLEQMRDYARAHGLALGAVGASDEFAAAARRAGMRHLYLGDEAMLRTGLMDLSGGSRKTLRKAVNRIARNDYTAQLSAVADLAPATLAELELVSDRWRDGAPERGFSMAHHTLADELVPDALVLVARDGDQRIRGFLHFMPVYGRPLASLGFMRRERDTPNGLTEFMVVEAARLLGEAGIAEFSLNFAAHGRWLRAPENLVERLLAVVLRTADRWFQVERLLRFNEKFEPRWQPRYLLFEHTLQLPRVAFGAMVAEAQSWVAPGLKGVKVGFGKRGNAHLGYEHDRDVAYMRAMREGLGPEAWLMIDCGWNVKWDVTTAVRRVQAFEAYDLNWIEEPLGAWDPEGYANLRAKTTTRIAYGEKEWDLAGFERILETGTVDVVGIDPGRAEGITGFRLAADRILAHRRQANAHAWSSAICSAASLAMSFSSPAFKLFELKPLRNPMQHDLVTQPFGHVDGWVYPPTGPGLGIEVIDEVVERYRSERVLEEARP
jgi:hypothetical protein